MKNNLTYYQHRTDSYRHPKFVLLRAEYGDQGWAMFGRVWALFDIIAESESCILDLSTKRNKAQLADLLKLEISELEDFLNLLKSEEISLIQEIGENKFTAEKIQEILTAVSQKREAARSRYKTGSNSKKVPQIETSGEVSKTSGENQESSGEVLYKGKERKGKEIIGKESRRKKCAASAFFEDDFSDKKLPDFVEAHFLTFANRSEVVFEVDVEPVLDLIAENSDNDIITDKDVREIIHDSFIALGQSDRDTTGYLLGIMRNKFIAKREEILKKRKISEQKQADFDRVKKNNIEQLEKDKKRDEELNELAKYYKENPQLFTAQEVMEIDKAVFLKNLLKLQMYVLPKMEAETTL